MSQLLKTKKEISDWLNEYNINNFELLESQEYGFVVNVNTSVLLSNKNLKEIKVQFNEVNGNFNCSQNQLKSLMGAPISLTRSFFCNDNELESLYGSPKEIKSGIFSCEFNKLRSLEYCPSKINGVLVCARNKIESLEFCPERLGGLDCGANLLTSLKFSPKVIDGNFICDHNKIDSLEYMPEYVGKMFKLDGNPIMNRVEKTYNFYHFVDEYKKEKIIKMKDELGLLLNNKDVNNEIKSSKKNKV